MADRKTNPNNPQNNLFRKLTRLLSGPLQTYRKQDPRRIGRNKIDKFADRFKSTSGQQFKRADEHHSAYGNMTANYMSNQNRAERYVDFDQMEYMPEIASAMDIYADEISTSSELNKILTVKTYDEEIKLELENLMFKILNIEFNLFGWARSMCKFGDFFLMELRRPNTRKLASCSFQNPGQRQICPVWNFYFRAGPSHLAPIDPNGRRSDGLPYCSFAGAKSVLYRCWQYCPTGRRTVHAKSHDADEEKPDR